MSESVVIVKPVLRKRPWVNTDEFNKNKLFGVGTKLSPYLDQSGLHTGLTEETQVEFEKKLGLKEGSLAPLRDSEFWDDFYITLQDEPNTFYKNNPTDELRIAVLKAHPKVANTQEEISPDTDFYILDVETEEQDKVKLIETKEKAYSVFSKLTNKGKRDLLKLYGEGGDSANDSTIKTALSEKMEQNPHDFLAKAAFSKEVITVRAFIFDLVDYGILRQRGQYYFDGDTNLGDIKSFSDYLLMPDKQDVYLVYKDRLSQAKLGS